MYGMPQPNTYGQYGFGGYAGFQGAGSAGTTGTNPGLQSTSGAGGLGNGTQPGPADPNNQSAQGQWPADANSYYSNYWGGKRANLSLFAFMNRPPIGYYGQPGQQGAADVQMNQN